MLVSTKISPRDVIKKNMKVAGMSTTTSALLLVLLVASGVSISEAVGGCGSHVTNGDRLFFL